MAKKIVIKDGRATLTDPAIKVNKDKEKGKKPTNMSTKEQIEYLYAYLSININEALK